MRKKPKKKSDPKLKFSFIRIVYLSIVLLVVSFLTYTYVSKNQNLCANSISCIKDLSGKYEANENKGEFMGKKIDVPSETIAYYTPKPVLGENTPSNKHIYVDLTNQRLYAYEGDRMVYNFLVSTGKWGRTPTGDFKIWIKLRYTRMSGGNAAIGTYYNLPNVPYVMFFSNAQVPASMGFSIHGTYWHNNFGHPMSHGCVNMKTEEVEKIYYWADPPTTGSTTHATAENPGTPITIYGEAPNE